MFQQLLDLSWLYYVYIELFLSLGRMMFSLQVLYNPQTLYGKFWLLSLVFSRKTLSKFYPLFQCHLVSLEILLGGMKFKILRVSYFWNACVPIVVFWAFKFVNIIYCWAGGCELGLPLVSSQYICVASGFTLIIISCAELVRYHAFCTHF